MNKTYNSSEEFLNRPQSELLYNDNCVNCVECDGVEHRGIIVNNN